MHFAALHLHLAIFLFASFARFSSFSTFSYFSSPSLPFLERPEKRRNKEKKRKEQNRFRNLRSKSLPFMPVCGATTRKGKPCENPVPREGDRCYLHSESQSPLLVFPSSPLEGGQGSSSPPPTPEASLEFPVLRSRSPATPKRGKGEKQGKKKEKAKGKEPGKENKGKKKAEEKGVEKEESKGQKKKVSGRKSKSKEPALKEFIHPPPAPPLIRIMPNILERDCDFALWGAEGEGREKPTRETRKVCLVDERVYSHCFWEKTHGSYLEAFLSVYASKLGIYPLIYDMKSCPPLSLVAPSSSPKSKISSASAGSSGSSGSASAASSTPAAKGKGETKRKEAREKRIRKQVQEEKLKEAEEVEEVQEIKAPRKKAAQQEQRKETTKESTKEEKVAEEQEKAKLKLKIRGTQDVWWVTAALTGPNLHDWLLRVIRPGVVKGSIDRAELKDRLSHLGTRLGEICQILSQANLSHNNIDLSSFVLHSPNLNFLTPQVFLMNWGQSIALLPYAERQWQGNARFVKANARTTRLMKRYRELFNKKEKTIWEKMESLYAWVICESVDPLNPDRRIVRSRLKELEMMFELADVPNQKQQGWNLIIQFGKTFVDKYYRATVLSKISRQTRKGESQGKERRD